MNHLHRTSLGLALAAALLCPSAGSAQPAKPPPAPSAPPSAQSASPPSAAPSASPPPSAAPSAPAPSGAPSAAPAPSAPDVYTQPAMSPSEEASLTFQQGREAFKADDFARALTLFQRSYALEASPGTLLNIALTEEKLGKTATALQSFQRVAALLPAGDDRLPIAREGVARTTLRAPRLKIERAAGAPPTLAIKLDGKPLAANLVGVEQPLDPGAHVITTHVYGFEERRYDITLAEGQKVPLAVEPGRRVLVAAPVNTASPGSSPAARLAVIALGGAGIASLGVGAVTGLLAVGKRGELDAARADLESGACQSPATCQSRVDRLRGEGQGFADVSTGTLAFGGLAVAVGALIFFTTGRDAFSVSASAGPGAGSLAVSGRF